MNVIVTIPPYAPFIKEVSRHPVVAGLRLNTVMPTKGSLDDVLRRILEDVGGKDLWIDLKARQLRVATYGVPPFTEIDLTHKITVDTPVTAYFADGLERATVVEVDGSRLIMQDGPKRVVGPGESINILSKSLRIAGFLTDTDKRYIEACQEVGLDRYMLSFVEHPADVLGLRKYHSGATVVAKIESQKGVRYVNNVWNGEPRLMAARGDLYGEVGRPHQIIQAMENIIAKDESAIAASRIFASLAYGLEPSCSDIGDVDNLRRMGYKTVMLGDEICQRRDSALSALNLLEAMNDHN
jgi:pyruvate kinase